MYFKSYKFTWGKFFLWFILCLLPGVGIYLSNQDIFFELGKSVTVGILIAVGTGAWIAIYTFERHHPTRNAAIYGEGIVCISLLLLLGMHQWLARDMADARDSTKEHHEEDARQEKLRRSAAERRALEDTAAAQRATAEAAKAKEERARTEAQNRQIKLLGGIVRRGPAPAVTPTPIQGPTLEPLELESLTKPQVPQAQRTKTTEEVRKSWSLWLAIGSWLDAFLAGLCCLNVLRCRMLDRNGNGIPDFDEAREEQPRIIRGLAPATTEARAGSSRGN